MPVMNCLKGCINRFENDPERVRKPLNTTVLMPWVQVTINKTKLSNDASPIDVKDAISVSNISSRNRSAIIKSFTFGASNSYEASIEIVDEAGGDFTKFFDAIGAGNKESLDKWFLRFRFGWAKRDSDNGSKTFGKEVFDPHKVLDPDEITMSRVHIMSIKKIGVSQQNGLFKFIIIGTSSLDSITGVKTPVSIGKDGGKIPLKTAVEELLSKYKIKVKFLDSNGNEGFRWLNEVDGDIFNGPKGVWNSLKRNPVQVAIDWVMKAVSANKRGCYPFFDYTATEPTLIFKETSNIGADGFIAENSIGTYIIGGGRCSPVISFTPQFDFLTTTLTNESQGGYPGPNKFVSQSKNQQQQLGGGTISTGAAGSTFDTGPIPGAAANCFDNMFDGTGLFGNGHYEDRNDSDWGLRDGASIAVRNQIINAQAYLPIYGQVNAELRVQGDPSFSDPKLWTTATAKIISIDPYMLARNSVGDTDWVSGTTTLNVGRLLTTVAAARCNAILSNRNWFIMGVHHEIREGSFITTLKMFLTGPQDVCSRLIGADPLGYTLPRK